VHSRDEGIARHFEDQAVKCKVDSIGVLIVSALGRDTIKLVGQFRKKGSLFISCIGNRKFDRSEFEDIAKLSQLLELSFRSLYNTKEPSAP